jgi:hypothetical protein
MINMLLAGLVSGVVGFSLRVAIGQVWAVIPVAAVMVLVYFGVSILLGIDDDERRVARSFLRPNSALVS